MAVRDILDYQGNVTGQLELPDDTPDEIWSEQLATYAVAPPDPAVVAITKTIEENNRYAKDLMKRMKALNLGNNMNIGQALWMHHRLRALDIDLTPLGMPMTLTLDILNLVVSGDIETGCVALQITEPDDMSMPYHCISRDFINWIVADMKSYLGWP
jgi:hypothetical protein